MHTIAILALDHVIPFDLSTPIEVFTRTRLPDGRPGYQIRVCAERPEVDAGAFSLRAPWGLEGSGARTRSSCPVRPTPPPRPRPPSATRSGPPPGRHAHRLHLLGHLPPGRHRAPGRPASHHPLGRRRPPGHHLPTRSGRPGCPVRRQRPDPHLGRRRRRPGPVPAHDPHRLRLGRRRRRRTAVRHAPGTRRRTGAVHRPRLPTHPAGQQLEPLLAWLQDNLATDLTLADIAAHTGTSTRTLIRRFREQTGTTPLQWLHRARIRQAQHLLESTHHTVERIGAQVGFGSATAFRDRFKQTTGVSPHSYRRAFS